MRSAFDSSLTPNFDDADAGPSGFRVHVIASGRRATIAMIFAQGAKLQYPAHKFSTKCLLMDRPVPTLCIDAPLREASNRQMCRC